MLLEQILKKLSSARKKQKVYVPALWIGNGSNKPVKVDYATFLSSSINEITSFHLTENQAKGTDWSKKAVIYKHFSSGIFTAYDHDQDGIIGQKTNDITINREGIRETGTFLKNALPCFLTCIHLE